MFEEYHQRVPFVKKLSEEITSFANENELLFTLYDRFCRFNKWETKNKTWNSELQRYDKVDLLTKQQAKERFELEYRQMWENPEPNFMDQFEFHYQPAFTYKALNRLIQGSAADMTKKAMVDLYEKGILPHIQIHDELCISIKDDNEVNVVKQTMEEAIPLLIKNKVSYKKGSSWGSAK